MDVKEIRKKRIEVEVEFIKLIRKFEEETGLDVSGINYTKKVTTFSSGCFSPRVNRIVELNVMV